MEAYLDSLNGSLLDALQRGGDVFVSNAVVRGHYALRACVVNFHTTAADVDAVPEIIARQGRRSTPGRALSAGADARSAAAGAAEAHYRDGARPATLKSPAAWRRLKTPAIRHVPVAHLLHGMAGSDSARRGRRVK